MSTYVRGFVITDVAQVHRAYQKLMADLEELVILERQASGGRSLGRGFTSGMFKGAANAAAALADVRISYRDFNQGLQRIARKTAATAEKDMIEKLTSDQRRPEKGGSTSLRHLLRAAPLPPIAGYQTGAVGVADVAELNRAINPYSRSYGPYWRAVEYGTGQAGVRSQIGRILYGSFTGAGGSGPTAPSQEMEGQHPIFISAGQKKLSPRGFGTIGREVPAKHFIKYGADAAAVQWREELTALQQRAIDELSSVARA